jgi:hypothetical protein
MKHILGASSQRQYEDATASLRGVLSQEAPPLALADFDSDMLRTTFGVTRHPSIGEMLQVERAERVSLSRVIGILQLLLELRTAIFFWQSNNIIIFFVPS